MKSVKVLLVGDYKENPSEGMEVITKRFSDRVRENGLDVTNITSKQYLIKFLVVLFGGYNCIIFTHGPGKGAYLLTALTSVFFGPKIIWVATRPNLSLKPFFDKLITRLEKIYCGKQDVRLIELANNCHASFEQVVIGIDFERIKSVKGITSITKQMLIGESGDLNAPVLLHVGHLRNNRGLDKLVRIKKQLKEKVNIVVLGSPSLSSDSEVINMLEDNQINIYCNHVSNLADVYNLTDLYVFPVDPVNGGAIDLPLSVIEALACGVHVISTPFGVLPAYFKNNSQMIFSDNHLVEEAVKFILSDSYKVSGEVVNELPYTFNIDSLIDKISGLILKECK